METMSIMILIAIVYFATLVAGYSLKKKIVHIEGNLQEILSLCNMVDRKIMNQSNVIYKTLEKIIPIKECDKPKEVKKPKEKKKDD